MEGGEGGAAERVTIHVQRFFAECTYVILWCVTLSYVELCYVMLQPITSCLHV